MNAPSTPSGSQECVPLLDLADVFVRKSCVPPGAQLVVFSTSAGLASNFCVPDLGSRLERISKTNG